MAKSVIIFVVLFIIQGSSQISLRDDLTEIGQEFLKAYQDAGEIITYVGIHLSGIARDYEHKIDDTLDNENIAAIVQNLQDAIHKVESEVDENSKSCIDLAYRQALVTTDELKRGIDSCISTARAVTTDIVNKLEDIDGKAFKIQEEILSGFSKCMSEELSPETVPCLREIIDPVKEKLTILTVQVTDTHEIVLQKAADGIKNLKICLQEEEHDFELKEDTILENLGKCVKSTNNIAQKYAPKGILDIIREIKEKIENILHIIAHLPTSIDEIQDKINEIASHINISTLISQLKDEIDEIFSDGGSNAEKCRPFANERMDSLVETSENAANKCMQDAGNRVDEIQASISALGDEAQEILGDIQNQTYQCFLENKLNPAEFYRCLENHVSEFQQRAADLQKKVGDIYENAKEQADDILKSLAKCMNKIQIDTIKEGQVIIKEVENCVLLSSDTYYMM